MSRIPAIFLYLFLAVANQGVVAETLPNINLIAPEGKAVNFGAWKIHNEGFVVTILDQNNFRLIKVHGNSSLRVSDADDKGFFLHQTGGSTPIDGFWYRRYSPETREAESIGEIQNGRYQFKKTIFLVSGDEMTFFNIRNENKSPILSKNVINKFDNSVVHSGRKTVTVIDPVSTVAPTPIPADPTAGGVIPIQPAHTGSWFDPATDGRGGFLNIADQGGQSVLVVSWFDYNEDGSQMWLVGNSEPLAPDATSAIVPVQITEKDGSGQVLKSDWGIFTFEFTSCDSGNLVMSPNSGSPVTIPLTRLTKIKGMSC